MLIVIVSSFSIVLAYFFLKPYMKTSSQRKSALRIVIIIVPLAIIAYWIVTYFTYYNKPESFEKGVELLESSKDIKGKIGSYESYTYFDKDLPKKTDNPASFKVSLKGSLATIYISCKVGKDTSGNWHLLEVKQDSLSKQ
ncbi:MAG: hypothetical protein JWQ57_216 [Mucilaginibacter sp.]|nr:hypothetical protein [Mucilaginibacter sp.]